MSVDACVSRVHAVLNSVVESGSVAVENYPPFPQCEQCSPGAVEPYCVKYPFHAAAMMGELDLLKKAVKKMNEGWHAEYDSRGYTALHCAIAKGKDEVVAWLLSIGVNPDAVSRTPSTSDAKWEVTPIFLASCITATNRSELICNLLKHGAHPNHPSARDAQTGATCLHNVSFYGELSAVKSLLKHGADHRALTRCGETAEMHATKGMPYGISPNGGMSIYPCGHPLYPHGGIFWDGHAQIIALLSALPK